MKKYVRIFGVMAVFVFAACDSGGGGGGEVAKSIKITNIDAGITKAIAGLYNPSDDTTIAAIIFNDVDNVSNGVVEGELFVYEGDTITDEEFTKTGSYNVFLEDKTNGKGYASKGKITIKDALTTVSFNDLEELE